MPAAFVHDVDWGKVIGPALPLAEIVVRGTLMYLGLLFLLRFVFKREAGTLSMPDLLVIVLIADAAQNAMAGEYTSVGDGFILVVTILSWAYVLDRLASRVPTLERLLHPPPLPLIRDGRLVRRNMRRESITEDELMKALREHGAADAEEVREAYLEEDGRISVIKRRGRATTRRTHERAGRP